MFRVCHAFLSALCSLVVTCWERAGLLALLCVIVSCVLSLYHVVSWVSDGTFLSISDLCLLSYFVLLESDSLVS